MKNEQPPKGWTLLLYRKCRQWFAVHECGHMQTICPRKRVVCLGCELPIPHEHYRRLLYRVYNVIARCGKPSFAGYADYGGRGICVHELWIHNPAEFVAHLATLPGWDDPTLTIDRIDNDGHYEPGNLRFATRKEQRANQRSPKPFKRGRKVI